MIHLRNKQSGYMFCKTKRPNVYSPNVSKVIYPYSLNQTEYGICPICEPYYKKWLEIK